MTESLQTFLNGLVDYAGLFPPAGLSMDDSVAAFARHRGGSHARGLARFVVPLSRLDEWSRAARPYLSNGCVPGDQAAPDAWGLSVLLDGPLEEGLSKIEQFNASHTAGAGGSHKHAHSALIDTIEVKIQTPEIIDVAADKLPEDLFPFFEVPVDADFRAFATALAGLGFGAKLRTGGVTPDLFPSVERIADFLITFGHAAVPIKCTAGLHHPIRSVQRLTYQPDSPTHLMHGFVNVFLAAALVRALEIDRATAISVLSETSPDAFRFDANGVAWRNLSISVQQLGEAREEFAICFGSCSFDDPINDLRKIGYL